MNDTTEKAVPAKKAVAKKTTKVKTDLAKALEVATPEVPTTANSSKPQAKRPKYTLSFKMGSLGSVAHGDDVEIFKSLEAEKVTNKCVFTLKNNETGKSFEVVYPPFMARKLIENQYVQKFQWKRLSGKVA